MKNTIVNFGFLFVIILLSSCKYHKEIKAIGDSEIVIFKDQIVNFDPNQAVQDSSIKVFTDGRIVMKKITIPDYKRSYSANLKLTLVSNGDRWDKSGSCFMIEDGKEELFVNALQGTASFPSDSTVYEHLKGSFITENYEPAVELIRFMTPFGIGYYNDSKLSRRPVYIPKWEEQVVWEEEVSHLLSQSKEVWIGVWIDVWTKDGYKIDLNLSFDESEGPAHAKKKYACKSLVNTVYYSGDQGYPDIFSRQDFEVNFNLDKEMKNAAVHYIVSGHGGHSGGDEFVKKENILSFDNEEIFRFTPWRDDCASFRRFNPGSGVWLIEDTARYLDWSDYTYKEKVIEERMASSDYSRSNWCPGSFVEPVIVELGDLSVGNHRFKISIPEAQESKEGELNHWLVSAYLISEE